MNVKAKAIGGPLDGQTVEANGETVHVPVARMGRPAEMFIYQLIDYRHMDGRQEWILRPMKGDPMSSELNQLFPVLPKGVTTPPGAVRIQIDGPDAASLVDVFGIFMAVANRRHGGFRGVVHEAQQRHEAQEKHAKEASRTASAPAETEPEPEASAAATTEEIGEST